MKGRHHTPEQVIRKLAEGEKLLAQGKSIEEVVRHLEITESTWHRWRNQYGGMKADNAKDLKELRAGEPAPEEDRRRPGPRHRHVEGAGPGKLLTPDCRRRAVVALQTQFGVCARSVASAEPVPWSASPARPSACRTHPCHPMRSSPCGTSPPSTPLGLQEGGQGGPGRRLAVQRQAHPPPLACRRPHVDARAPAAAQSARRAVTSWRYTADLHRYCPHVRVSQEVRSPTTKRS